MTITTLELCARCDTYSDSLETPDYDSYTDESFATLSEADARFVSDETGVCAECASDLAPNPYETKGEAAQALIDLYRGK